MREIDVSIVRDKVKEMCIEANFIIGDDIKGALQEASQLERSPIGISILEDLLLNADIAARNDVPICQDTGMAVIFIELGQEVHFTGGNVSEAIHEGVRLGYSKGYLRKSVVADPLLRKNTNDNTPAIIYYDVVPGNEMRIMFSAKGFGSENMSRSKMLKPSDGVKGVVDFVLETVSLAGPNPCPPIVVGVGIGGTLDKAAQIAKRALLRNIHSKNDLPHIADLESDLLMRINKLGIGPQGLGGDTTALGVNVEVFPTHIAGLPVVVNINCHASRHLEAII